MSKIFVVVLNWNRPQETIACVHSVQALDYPGVEVVVVDNGSSDDSVRCIQDRFPGLVVLANAQNLGFAQGNNIGIGHALKHGADYVFLLNNDALVDGQCLKALVDVAAQDPAIGILGPKIYEHANPDRLWFAGAMIDWVGGDSPHMGIGQKDNGQCNHVLDVDRLTGCAMLIRREVFDAIGLFDPDYFLYYEDVDFCERARRHGFKAVCVQGAKAWHKISSSSQNRVGVKRRAYYHMRNKLLFLKKHGRAWDKAAAQGHEFCRAYIRHVLRHPFDRKFRQEQSPLFWAIHMAIKDFMRGVTGKNPRGHGP